MAYCILIIMRLYNTLSRAIEDFNPIDPKNITFYHCGPTVYWVQHIGNLRAMTWADLIRRSLTFLGYHTQFVRNYTDVGHLVSDADAGEDKMEKGAKRENITPHQIADKYIAIFESDTSSLNILEPDHKPRATEFIPQMIEMIKVLIEKGYAYQTEQAVVYDISKFPSYNKLNRQKLEFNQAGSGKGTGEDPGKKHFADFNLWVFKKGVHAKALQTWESPWGEGFPGWHIECSVMAKHLLGDTIDIHMGGVEHISVHHTNEIAQSEAANAVPFVHYWMHNEHLDVDERKMAKSEGTGFTLDQIKNKGYNPLALRYFFLQAHYRSKQNFTWEALDAAKNAYQKLTDYVISLKKQSERSQLSNEKMKTIDDYRDQFAAFINEDFQIPQAVAMTWDILKSNIPSTDKLDLLYSFDEVFGLRLREVEEAPVPEEIMLLAKQRDEARKLKDFAKADTLRKEIEEKGYVVKDTSTETTVKRK